MINPLLLIVLANSDYHNRYGGICKQCGAINVFISKTMQWVDGERKRYHVCDCGYHFVTFEAELPLPDKATPEIIKVLEVAEKQAKRPRGRKKKTR